MKQVEKNIKKSDSLDEKDLKKEDIGYENVDFYEKLYNYLITLKGVETKQIEKGDICLYFESWRDPYRVDNEIVYENCMEIIIGVIKNPSSLIFSEAICLNTYHNRLNFIDGNSSWSQGSRSYPKEYILVNKHFYQQLKKHLNLEEWSNDISFSPNYNTIFVKDLEAYIRSKFFNEEFVEDSLEIEILDVNNSKMDFERADFYDNLINILLNQDEIKKESLEVRGNYLIFDIWRDPYRVGNEIINTNCIDVLIANVSSLKPLKFSEVINLNTYQGNLKYTKGNIVWSQSSADSYKNFLKIDHHLFQRLNLKLKTKKWTKDTTYSKKDITAFVTILENYFTGKYPGKNFEIVQKSILVKGIFEANEIISIQVKAKEIAEEAKPGQFVVLRLHERGERIPLTIADVKKDEGLIRIIFQIAGKTTEELAALDKGDYILDFLGPLGHAVEMKKYNKPVICVGGGVGLASIYSKAKTLKKMGNYVISIIGARSKELLILEKEMRAVTDELYITTDDGFYEFTEDGSECFHRVKNNGLKVYGGYVSHVLEALLGKSNLLDNENKKVNNWEEEFATCGPSHINGKYSIKDIAEVIAVGPLPMMMSIVNITGGNSNYTPEQHYKSGLIKTLVSLNPIMVDGTGMCGGCRVRMYNPAKNIFETKFACIDGPVFDGHLVDFKILRKRNIQYVENEKTAVHQLDIVGW